MNAWRELDILIAEKVMGWHRNPHDEFWTASDDTVTRWGTEDCVTEYAEIFRPSTSIAAAWEIMSETRIAVMPLEDGGWAAVHTDIHPTHGTELYILPGSDDECYGWAKADTAPLAICLAALKAIGVKA